MTEHVGLRHGYSQPPPSATSTPSDTNTNTLIDLQDDYSRLPDSSRPETLAKSTPLQPLSPEQTPSPPAPRRSLFCISTAPNRWNTPLPRAPSADAKSMAPTHRDFEKAASDLLPGSQPRPLVDFITNNWQQDDSDDEYYRRDSDNMIHPRWKHVVAAPMSRIAGIPRRVQRYVLIYATLLVVAWVTWTRILKPDWESTKSIIKSLEDESRATFGSNMRPEFSDMVHIKTMDSRLLPTDENFRRRLIVVGDVHGCKDERMSAFHQLKGPYH